MTKAGDEQTERATPVERDWIAAARAMLIEGGVAAVQINPLATRLGVTRGGFYWRFRNRQDLLDHLLRDWRDSNIRIFLRAADRTGPPRERYRRIVRLLLENREFDSSLDSAIRQWARVEPEIAAQVLEADKECIAALARIFTDAGQSEVEARVRARIVYFHQVGYWAIGFHETLEERRTLAPVYTRLLTGFED